MDSRSIGHPQPGPIGASGPWRLSLYTPILSTLPIVHFLRLALLEEESLRMAQVTLNVDAAELERWSVSPAYFAVIV